MSTHTEPKILDAGDAALVIEFGDGIDAAINGRVLALDAAVRAIGIAGLVETVPTYRSLMVQVEPLVFDYEGFVMQVKELLTTLDARTVHGQRWRVPVVYGGEFGIDLDAVAGRHGLTPTQLIDIHARALYPVGWIRASPRRGGSTLA